MLAKNLLALSCLATFSVTALADGADYIKFRKSSGNGAYNKFNQNPAAHTITINADGRTGRYCLAGGNNCGQLFDIQFDRDSDIRGKWNFNGTRGTFQWNFFSQKEFDGGFRFNQNMQPSEEGSIYIPFDGEWNGSFN